MTILESHIPDAKTLLAMPLPELAAILLQVGHSASQRGKLHIQDLSEEIRPFAQQAGGAHNEVSLAVAEGWAWLINRGLLVPDSGPNGANGWMLVSRAGQKLLKDGDFKAFAFSINLPKESLHPAIADEVWGELLRHDFASAVFKAFKAVEIAVREAGRFAMTDYGVDLMRKAFHTTTGPLSDPNQPVSEREALSALFAGAIGSYKNPHSHRNVPIDDPFEAQEMIMLASHLLRIVDSRTSRPQKDKAAEACTITRGLVSLAPTEWPVASQLPIDRHKNPKKK